MRSANPIISLSILVGCASGKPDGSATDTGGAATVCPDWIGIDESDGNSNLPGPRYTLSLPPHESFRVDKRTFQDIDTGQVTVDFWSSPFEDIQFDINFSFTGLTKGKCTAEGYSESSRTTTWTLTDPFERYLITSEITTVWDPPLLVVPSELEYGTHWTVESTATTTSSAGSILVAPVMESYEVIASGPIDTVLGELDGRLVESSTGVRAWYTEEAGFVLGDGLILIGSWVEYDDD